MSLISLLENMGGRTPACAEFYHWFDRSKESKYVRVHLSQETAPGSPLWLAAIQSHKKNAGYTRTVMQHVLRVADKHQLPIMLVVDDESESWHWLESWYERLGFKKTGNQREYGPEMRREPQGSLTEATQYFTGFNHQPPRHLTQKYMRGECVYLALAFHAVKRYEIVELGPEHVATRDPEGFFWDIRGKMTETQAMDGVSPGEIKVVTKDEAIGLLGAFSDGPFVGSRLRAAKDVVRALS